MRGGPDPRTRGRGDQIQGPGGGGGDQIQGPGGGGKSREETTPKEAERKLDPRTRGRGEEQGGNHTQGSREEARSKDQGEGGRAGRKPHPRKQRGS